MREETRRPAERRRRRRRRRSRLLLPLLLLAAGGGLLWALTRGLPGEDVPVPDYVEKAYLPENPWSRPGIQLEKVEGIVIHYVGNPGTTARANRNYFASLSSGAEETYASSHFVVGLEGEVVQCIPLTEIAYATGPANDSTISIEVCHPDETGEFSPVTYDRAAELTAYLCREFRLDPEEDVIRHYDVTGKLCPKYYVDHPEAWDTFRKTVAGKLAALEEEE